MFTIGRNGQYVEFRVPRTLAMNLIVKYEVDTWMSYETRDIRNNVPLPTTLVPLMIPNSDPLSMFCVETTNNFFLRDSRIIMIPEVLGHDWTSFSEIEAESDRIRNAQILPEPLQQNTSSGQTVGPFACSLATASASSPSVSGEPSNSKMPRPS